MTYIAWEAKLRHEALSTDEASRDALAGPPLVPAACDANVEESSPHALQEPLTPRGLLTVLCDLGTEQAFKDSKSLQPRAEPVTPKEGKRPFLRLWIRGMKDTNAYPCFDKLDIREKMCALSKEVSSSAGYEQDNKMPLPLYNPGAQPESRSRVNEMSPQSLDWSSLFTNSDRGQSMEVS